MSQQPKVAAYGTWSSPISADLIAKKAISFDDVLIDPITSTVYHIEMRPSEGGRLVIVKTDHGTDVFGKDWNARTGVEEYGGASAIVHNGVVYFSNLDDGRIYKVETGGTPVAITPENKNHRFANFAIHPSQTHWIVSILEDHTPPEPADVVTSLVLIDTRTSTVSPFVSGADFYSSPKFSPDGSKFAWQQWKHPDMPWEGAKIFVAHIEIKDGALILRGDPLKIAGEAETMSAVEPTWQSSDTLLFTYDMSGYKNPWIAHIKGANETKVGPILSEYVSQDFGEPGWELGGSCYAVLGNDTVLFTAFKEGRSVLYLVDISKRSIAPLDSPFVYIAKVRCVSSNQATFLAKEANAGQSIVLCTFNASLKPTFSTLKSSASDDDSSSFPQSLISLPKPLSVTVPPKNEPLHLIFYPPTNPTYAAPVDEKPPCILNIHGGPTGMEPLGLDLRKQYFTSRGWAWVDVNYGGSSGFGRQYIDRLRNQWGVVDVQDCIQSVRQLASPTLGLIDPKRAVIRGGSSGGFTVLAAMCAASDVYAAGTSSYGISDLRKLEEFTHKFESHYLDKLIGGTYEQIPEVFKARSPVYHADKIKSPLLILQGSIDAVVPPSQAEDIVKSIRKAGGRVEYIVFEGEGHGWRKAENIIAALEKELAFYMDVLGLKTIL